jgi:hypothetical protein
MAIPLLNTASYDFTCVEVSITGITSLTLDGVVSISDVGGETVESSPVTGCRASPYGHTPGRRIAKDMTIELSIASSTQLIEKLGGRKAALDGSKTFDLTIKLFHKDLAPIVISATALTCRVVDMGWSTSVGSADPINDTLVIRPLKWADGGLLSGII